MARDPYHRRLRFPQFQVCLDGLPKLEAGRDEIILNLFPPCMLIFAQTSPVAAASVFEQILWWVGNAAEALILLRSIRQKLYEKYPAFYFYLGTVLLLQLFRFSIFVFYPNAFPAFYWYTQFLPATVGYAVILEIFKLGLKSSPGAARMARTVLWGVLGTVILKVFVDALSGSTWSMATSFTELERNLRTVQALLILAIIAVLAFYAVPNSRNLKGIIFGYGLYICASVMSLAFGSLPGNATRPGWRHVQPIAYLAALFIWTYSLWSRQPDPETEDEPKIERDYRLIAKQTGRALSKIRSYFKMGGEL